MPTPPTRLRPGRLPAIDVIVTPRPARPAPPVTPPRRPTPAVTPPPARPTPARPVAPPPVIDVPVRADVRAREIIDELHALKAEMASMVHRAGTLLRELQDPHLIAAVRCTTFEQVLAKFDLPIKPTAIKYIAVAEAFSADEAKQLGGVERGYAIVRYTNAVVNANKAPAQRKTPAEVVRLNPTFARKPVLAHEPHVLHAAIKAYLDAKRGREAEGDDTAAEADRMVRKMGPRFRKLGAPGARLKRVRRGGKYLVQIELDPDEAMAFFGRLPSS